MKLLAAFFKLIRWPNLIFIVLTQVLFYFFIIPFVYRSSSTSQAQALSMLNFWMLVIASVCIAAAGYIINDYFDLSIDRVNKPSRLIIERIIKRRWAIVMHVLMSAIGLLLSMYVGYKISNISIPVFNFISIIVLWSYSATLKKKLLIGNVVISLLTAWVIMVLAAAIYRFRYIDSVTHEFVATQLLKFSFLYAGFAFIISLIREVVKDIEDIRGDKKYGCKTMPIVWGVPAAKVFTGVWLVVLISALIVLQFYMLQLGWLISAVYTVLFLIIPLIWILKKLYDANNHVHYHKISSAIKLVMLFGILSMIFFRLYM